MSADPARHVLLANADAIKRGLLPMWTVYAKPRDYPSGVIARRFEVGQGAVAATEDTLVGALDDLRDAFCKAGLTKLMRHPDDEPQIVETWV